MFDDVPMNPAALAAMTDSAPRVRIRKARDGASGAAAKGNTKAGGQGRDETHPDYATSPLIADCQSPVDTHYPDAVGNTQTSDAAIKRAKPTAEPPHAGSPTEDGGHNICETQGEDAPVFRTNPAHLPAILAIRHAHRLRQRAIVANTKLTNQCKAIVRGFLGIERFGDRDSPEAKAAEKFVDAEYKKALADPASELNEAIAPYLRAQEPLEAEIQHRAKVMIRELRKLPIIDFCKKTKGLGDVSLATIIAEATSVNRTDNEFGKAGEVFVVGDFKSVSALWKRLGVAVIDGHRQGNPGAGATEDTWVTEGYNRKRRSVLWNATGPMILGMGKWRPAFGEDVDANPDLTPQQRIFAKRVRLESDKLGLPVTTAINAKGEHKESYKKHATNRALRYLGKCMVADLFSEWRRSMA
jgi:hypothetical protein